jgi:hypothetical protein
VATGLLGALVMMAFMAIAAGVGGDALDPLRAVGTSFRGDDATRAGAGPVVWGAVVQLALGAASGAALAAVFPKDLTAPASVTLGGGSGLILMAFALSSVAPAVAPLARPLMSPNGGAWVIAHALFGSIAGLAPWLHRRIRAGGARRTAPHERAGALRPRTAP